MTTTEDYLELKSHSDKIESMLTSTEKTITTQIIKFDFLSGYRSGLAMINSAANKAIYDDKKPETMQKLANQVKTRIELFKENINNSITYPLQDDKSREHVRGQIAGISAAARILFKFNVLKTIGEDIAYFKMAQMQPAQETVQTHIRR